MSRVAAAPDTSLSRRGAAWLGSTGLIGIAFFVVADIVAVVGRPGYSPIDRTVSDLGIGETGWLTNASAVILGLSLAGVAVAFYLTVHPQRSGVLRAFAATLLACVGVGFLLGGVFPETQLGLHYTGAVLAFLGALIGFPAAGLLLRRDPAWRPWGDRSLLVSLVLVVVVGVMVFTFSSYTFDAAGLYRSGEWGGLMERVVFGVVLLWFAAAGYLIFRGESPDQDAARPMAL